MFRFNFSEDNSTRESTKSMTGCSERKQNAECSEIVPELEVNDFNFKPMSIDNITFHVRDLENASDSKDQNFINLYRNCDVIPAVYEGGLKVWECTYDLLLFLSLNDVNFSDKTVLDLGCGCGLLGIYAALRKAESVHFQDYNVDVLRNFTIPNVIRNEIEAKTRFFSGDWDSFADVSQQCYDYILCSEVLYNSNNYLKLRNIFKRKLCYGGKVIMASKSYYFGVGGSVQQFEQFLGEMRIFSCQTVWKTNEGVQREILIIEKRDEDGGFSPVD